MAVLQNEPRKELIDSTVNHRVTALYSALS